MPQVEQTTVHFELEGTTIFKESEEAKRQMAAARLASSETAVVSTGTGTLDGDPDGAEEKKRKKTETKEAMVATNDVGEQVGDNEFESEDEEEEEDGEDIDGEAKSTTASSTAVISTGSEGRLRNQFNFSERAAQTRLHHHRDQGTATDPPARATFSATASQWAIYDAYVRDEAEQQALKEKKQLGQESDDHRAYHATTALHPKKTSDGAHSDVLASGSQLAQAAMKMERMVNQNTFDEILHDFKYWDDESDEFRPAEGSLLPLWKFAYEDVVTGARRAATALQWNPRYTDLFVVGLGSYEYTKQSRGGLVCCFSLKNPSYPEYIISTHSGVVSVDFNPHHPSLLAVGLYDGTVEVYNVKATTNARSQGVVTAGEGAEHGGPEQISVLGMGASPVERKGVLRRGLLARSLASSSVAHTDPVWTVRWQRDDLEGNANCVSVAGDGRAVVWTLVKNELLGSDLMEIQLPSQGVSSLAGPPASVTSLAFNPTVDALFVVGTDEGFVVKCDKAYRNQSLQTYEAHDMSVYGVHWNLINTNVFASCSADWSVKVWDHNKARELCAFDLGAPVGDVAWAPYSATVFAAITDDGKVHVFDVAINKYDALASQHITRKARLTHISFHPSHPILIVSDDKGTIHTLKLSPNLRTAMTKKTTSKEEEMQKFEAFVAQVSPVKLK